jgi:hypothetical protein
MNRQEFLSALVLFNAPISDLRTALALLNWDDDPVVILTRRNIAIVLDRFKNSEIDADTVEEWANLIECREDIRYESGHENTIAEAIQRLANPVLYGPLAEVAPNIQSSLR